MEHDPGISKGTSLSHSSFYLHNFFFATNHEILQFFYRPLDVSRGDPASRFSAAVQTEFITIITTGWRHLCRL